MPREKRVLVDVSAKIHRKFKIEAAKNEKTMSGLLCAYMEKYVADGNPGHDVEKKTDNPGDDLRSPEEILADKIIESRKILEAIKKSETEVPELEVHTTKPPKKEPEIEVPEVEKMDEIRYTKNPEKEPVDESLEVHTVEKPDEIRTVKKPEEEPEEELEEEPVEESAAEKNPGDEKENDEYEFSNPDGVFPFNLLRRKKQKKEKKL